MGPLEVSGLPKNRKQRTLDSNRDLAVYTTLYDIAAAAGGGIAQSNSLLVGGGDVRVTQEDAQNPSNGTSCFRAARSAPGTSWCKGCPAKLPLPYGR